MSNWQSDSFLLLLCHKISVLHHSIFATPVRDEKGQNISFRRAATTPNSRSPAHAAGENRAAGNKQSSTGAKLSRGQRGITTDFISLCRRRDAKTSHPKERLTQNMYSFPSPPQYLDISLPGKGHTEGLILLFLSCCSQHCQGCSNCGKNQPVIL